MRTTLVLALLASAVAAVALMGKPAPRVAAPAAARGGAVPAAGARVPDFSLTDSAGRPVHRRDLRGPWVASFFFSRCAGQCPMMLANLRSLSARLPGVRLVSFSLDPADTPKVLAEYARARGAGWTFLTGASGRVERLAREGFLLPAGAGNGSPAEPIIHSDRLVLVDAAGLIRGAFDPSDPAGREALVRAARELGR